MRISAFSFFVFLELPTRLLEITRYLVLPSTKSFCLDLPSPPREPEFVFTGLNVISAGQLLDMNPPDESLGDVSERGLLLLLAVIFCLVDQAPSRQVRPNAK